MPAVILTPVSVATRRLLPPIVLVFVVSSCSDPKEHFIPVDQSKWDDSAFRSAITKLEPEEREALEAYLLRGMILGIPPGQTIREAIQEQKAHEVELGEQRLRAEVESREQRALRRNIMRSIEPTLGIQLVGKKFRGANYRDRFEDDVVLTFAVENTGAKDIIGVKGRVVLEDVFGDQLASLSLRIDKTVPSGKSIRATHSYKIKNFYRPPHQERLLSLSVEDIQLAFFPEAVVFEDGTTLELQQGL